MPWRRWRTDIKANTGVPDTPYLLLVQVQDAEGYAQMMRVGMTKQMKNGLAKEGVPLVENKVGLELLMNS